MATDEELDDARVLAALGRILTAGDPYTSLPLVDPDTDLFPEPTMLALAAVLGGGGGGSTPDATALVKGKVQLAGDLGGTAAAPTVPGLASKAPLSSPAFTDNPTAPTQSVADNTTKLATTAFVKLALDALIAAAPGTLNTLDELAAALGDDPNFATTITGLIAAKIPTSLADAKGDLIVATGNDAVARLAVGTNGYEILADSTQATGVRWGKKTVGAIIVTTGTEARLPVDVCFFLDPSNLGATNALATDPIINPTALAILRSLIDAKGDLIVGSANDTPVRLPVGADGTFLKADSAQAGGMSWGTPAGGGGGRGSWPAALIISDKKYQLPQVRDGGETIAPTADRLTIYSTHQPFRVKIKSFIPYVVTPASATALVEFVLYDGATGSRIVSFGTADMSGSDGMRELTLGTSVEIPEFAVWGTKLRSASANGGLFRAAAWPEMHWGANPWDTLIDQYRQLSGPSSGTGAAPSTLPTIDSSDVFKFPMFGVRLEAV